MQDLEEDGGTTGEDGGETDAASHIREEMEELGAELKPIQKICTRGVGLRGGLGKRRSDYQGTPILRRTRRSLRRRPACWLRGKAGPTTVLIGTKRFRDLKMDYSSIDFEDVEYWIRSG